MMYIQKDGFEFSAFLYPYNQKDAITIDFRTHSIDEYREYINQKGIEQARIRMCDLEVLKVCPTLKHLRIFPSRDYMREFDVSALYEVSEIKSLQCINCYGVPNDCITKIDFSRIKGITDLSIDVNKGTLNYDKVHTLKSLCVGSFAGKHRNLTDLFCSKELDTLRLIQCRVASLDGIENSTKMQCLYLDYNRCLQDISALKHAKSTLKILRIVNCPKIEDFSVLGELENLVLLELVGSNTLPSLSFLKTMKNLKTFIFDMNVLDGDLSPCLNLSFAFSVKNRRHYNLKDSDLPKGKYIRGNDTIEVWRRLE